MTSSIVSGMMLTWYQTQRFANISYFFFWLRIMHIHPMLTVFSVTRRTSRSFWKFPTVSRTSVWPFTEWGGHCFWTSWTFKSCSWAPLRYSRVFFLQTFILLLFQIFVPLFSFFHDGMWFKRLCSPCHVHVVDWRLDMAERVLPAANGSEVAEEKEE